MILEVYEAGVLEAFENGFSSRLFRGGVIGEEETEVDELSCRALECCKCHVSEAYRDIQVVLRDCRFLRRAYHCSLFGVAKGRAIVSMGSLDLSKLTEALSAWRISLLNR